MLIKRRVAVVVVSLGAVVAAVAWVVVAGRDTAVSPGAAAPTARVVQPGAPGQTSRTLSPEEVARMSAPAHSAADVDFMRKMINHHLQALEMTALVDERAGRADLRPLAERIEVSQKDEIALMQRWLVDRDEELPEPHADHVGHRDLMPGMLGAEELAALAAARGGAFDRMFLELMIRHHQGAITMVDQLYRAGGGVESASDQLAREVNADQAIEIRRMRDMLASL